MPAGLSCHTGTRTAAARRSHPAAGPSAPTPCGCWERLPSAEGRGGAESVAETGSEVLVKGGRVRRLRACGVGRGRSPRAQTWRRSGERPAECRASRPRSRRVFRSAGVVPTPAGARSPAGHSLGPFVLAHRGGQSALPGTAGSGRLVVVSGRPDLPGLGHHAHLSPEAEAQPAGLPNKEPDHPPPHPPMAFLHDDAPQTE